MISKIFSTIKQRQPVFLMLLTIVMTSFADAAWSETPSNRGFEEVAKTSIPAVVSIRVSENLQNITPYGGDTPRGQPEQFDPFEEFWHRFFGITPRGHGSQQPPKIGQGSGFLVSPDGYILTNSHVVRSASEINVILTDGREFEATLVGYDQNTDVAIIKIEGDDFPHLTLGNSEALEVGQWVVAVGNPLGLQASLTVGVVSAKGRDNLHITDIEDFIQTDAAINRGNSGGPLLNLDGEVIGINTAIATNTGGYMGIGFAIPSNIVSNVMDQLINTGKVTRGFLGVTLQHIDKELADAFGLEKIEGALIADVIEGSPAEKAGLRQGDVIVEYNGAPVNNLSSIRNAVSLMAPGKDIALTVKREGKTFPITVKIGSHPNNQQIASEISSKVNFDVTGLTPEIAQQLGYVNDKGVIIANVVPGSTAELAGLRRGQLIVAVNQKKISSPEEFYKELETSANGNKRVLLLVKQGQYTRFVSLRMK